MEIENEEDWEFPSKEMIECWNEAERAFVTKSYPGRLLDGDGQEIATVRVAQADDHPESWIAYLVPREQSDILSRNPSALVQWDHPTKHHYRILQIADCKANPGSHYHIQVAL